MTIPLFLLGLGLPGDHCTIFAGSRVARANVPLFLSALGLPWDHSTVSVGSGVARGIFHCFCQF